LSVPSARVFWIMGYLVTTATRAGNVKQKGV
jgi:hypothetical protein